MRRGRKRDRSKVFGCDLLEHLTATGQDVPLVLRSCCEFVEEHGIVDGIYRLSGVSSNIQKLRSEFDKEGLPDLNKDVYMQDIHCVSSLCKAYFRELPNPLLTYQLYDHFADAVAVQLEDERLKKIQKVLKNLPLPHYRTLEYLMHHLVKMAGCSTETNMHARNLAIVWAPNLLRSKSIETSGFVDKAAFMEVRVQSIVVEFILNHVPDLFPELGVRAERRKSLPSPSVLADQEDTFFRAIPLQLPSNLCPGDGPPSITPYHVLTEGTDKRKGSLKGRKWRSIFNLGGRIHDPRKKIRSYGKDKGKTDLRPAKSMDSLNSGPDSHEVSVCQVSPSPLAMPNRAEAGSSSGTGATASSYVVTYRRGGGACVSVVSGGGGTQGTYSRLDSGTVPGGGEGSQNTSRSPGLSSRAERRAGIHIPVTVPLNMTSGLAFGLLLGGRGDEGHLTQMGAEGQKHTREDEKTEKKGIKGEEEGGEDHKEEQTATENKSIDEKEREERQGDGGIRAGSEEEEERKEQEKEDKPTERERDEHRDSVAGELPHAAEEAEDQGQTGGELASHADPVESEYMDMKAGFLSAPDAHNTQDTSGALAECNAMATEEESKDYDLPLDFHDTFGFLDSMDLNSSYQFNEFSVEPPGYDEEDHNDDDDEEDKGERSPTLPSEACRPPAMDPYTPMRTPINTHMLLPGKSHSLPYRSKPFLTVLSSSDEDEESSPDEEDEDSDLAEYEDMFYCSLPCEELFRGLRWSCPPTETTETSASGSKVAHPDMELKLENSDPLISPVSPKNGVDCPCVDQSEDSVQAHALETANSCLDACPVDGKISPNILRADIEGVNPFDLTDCPSEKDGSCKDKEQEDREKGGGDKEGGEDGLEEQGNLGQENPQNESASTESVHADADIPGDMPRSRTGSRSVDAVDEDVENCLVGDHSSSPNNGLPEEEIPIISELSLQDDTESSAADLDNMCKVEGTETASDSTVLAPLADTVTEELTEEPTKVSNRSLTKQGDVMEEGDEPEKAGEMEVETERARAIIGEETERECVRDEGTERDSEEVRVEGRENEEDSEGKEVDKEVEVSECTRKTEQDQPWKDCEERADHDESGGMVERMEEEQPWKDCEERADHDESGGMVERMEEEQPWKDCEERADHDESGGMVGRMEEEQADTWEKDEHAKIDDGAKRAEKTDDAVMEGKKDGYEQSEKGDEDVESKEKVEDQNNVDYRREQNSYTELTQVTSSEATKVEGDGEERGRESKDSPTEKPAECFPRCEAQTKTSGERQDREGAEEDRKTEPTTISGKEQSKSSPDVEEKDGETREDISKGERKMEREAVRRGKRVELGPGVGRTVVTHKHSPTKVYQVKAVPIVPPKPQYTKLTAFNLRHQFQHRDPDKRHSEPGPHRSRLSSTDKTLADAAEQHRDPTKPPEQSHAQATPREAEQGQSGGGEQPGDSGRDMPDGGLRADQGGAEEQLQYHAVEAGSQEEQDKAWWGEQGGRGRDEESHGRERCGTWDGAQGVRRHVPGEGEGKVKRNSGISICFDEAVARATGRRGRDRDNSERERERGTDLHWGRSSRIEGLNLGETKEEEGKTD